MLFKHILITFIFIGIATMLAAQNCLPGGIFLKTQNDIDSFSIRYPGCTVIEGEVCIGDCQSPYASSNIKNLDGLSQLTSILGGLLIWNNDSLTSLTGLNNLTVFENGVSIARNEMLASLDGIDQIRVIRGPFILDDNSSLDTISGFEMLDSIVDYLEISNMSNLTSLTAFSNLKYLGSLYMSRNDALQVIHDLNHLEYLGGFHVERNHNLTDLPDFPLLSTIHGDFIIRDNFNLTRIVTFDNIKRITGSLEITVDPLEHLQGPSPKQIIGFHNLTFVGGDLRIPYVDRLDTLDAFTKVDTIGNALNINLNHAVQNFPQPNKFKYIGGSIRMEGIANLENLECFSELDSIRGGLSLRFCSNLESLSGIDHITRIGGSLSLSQVGLIDLSNLSNLNYIDGSLVIDICPQLTNLSGLEGVNAINGELFIFLNPQLESLEGIHNIDPQTIRPSGNFAINIISNPKLSICNIENICNALRIYRKTYRISGNATGCKTINEIECVEFGLSGIVFYDQNQNKIQDPTEVGVPGIQIRIAPEDQLLASNVSGRYLFISEEGTEHTISIEQGSDWLLTTDSLQYTRVFNVGSPTNKNNNFGIYPEHDWLDLPVSLTSDPTRCNQYVKFYLHYLNGGTIPVNGKVVLQYDTAAVFFNSIKPANTHDIGNHELIWEIDALNAFHYEDVAVTFKMPDQTFTGQQLQFSVRSFIDSSGIEIEKDLVTYSPVIKCAFDPNDKIVMPPGIRQENYTLNDDVLTYTVRFENLGNAEAIDITVFDTLDAALDVSTFKVISSSYPVFASLNGHAVRFFFMNIWLGKNKRGYVTYEIKPKNDIADITPARNKAAIVFDFNQPVITNTTLNTLVEQICENVNVMIDTVICEGENYLGYTETGTYFDTVQIGSICDSFVQVNLTVREANTLTQFLDACIGSVFLYHGEEITVDSSFTLTDTIFSPEGCPAEIFVAHIHAYPPDEIQIDTAICQGELFHGFGETGMYTYDSFNVFTGCEDHIQLNLVVIPLGEVGCITGTTEADDAALKIYPNPANSSIFLEASNTIESISMYAGDGIVLHVPEIKLMDHKAELQLKDQFPDGLYILEIRMEGIVYFRKVVVIRDH